MDLSKIPLYWGTIISIIVFLGIGVWALLRPKAYIYQGVTVRKKWMDVRYWALLAMVLQIIVYVIWGGAGD